MLAIMKTQTINGITVYGDDEDPTMFYLLPSQPRFRLNDDGTPVFKFLKYRNPIDKPDGSKGGGFLIFDSEFVVPDDVQQQVVTALQAQLKAQVQAQGGDITKVPPVKVGTITYTKGSAALQFLDSGGSGSLVQKVWNGASPSLFGRNICSFSCELTPEGAAVAEQALQGSGGVVQVIYNLTFPAKLPDVTGTVWFDADKFYVFAQSIAKTGGSWDSGPDQYHESTAEGWSSSDAGGVNFDFSALALMTDQTAAQKLQDDITNWGWGALGDAVKAEIPSDITAQADRGLPDGMNSVTRFITTNKMSSFRRYFREGMAVDWNDSPQGTLPNITSLKTKDGKAIKWSDYAATIDADDPFFQQLRITASVDCDFQTYPIDSVALTITYPNIQLMTAAGAAGNTARFTKPDDMAHFAAYLDATAGRKFSYSYQVTYKDDSRTYQSDTISGDDENLRIAVDGLGVLVVKIYAGAINWTAVSQAQVTFNYQDGSDVNIQRQFVLDKDDKTFLLSEVILKPWTKPYSYSIHYIMADGSTYDVPAKQLKSSQLAIDDPFNARKKIGVRAGGSFDTTLDTIFIDLGYSDTQNNYSLSTSIALTKTQPFFDWIFPAISDGGTVTYSGSIKYKNGNIETIPQSTATTNTILIQPKVTDLSDDQLSVTVDPTLVDFSKVKLVKVSLHYKDAGNGIEKFNDMVFKPANSNAQTWTVQLADKTQKSFDWQATFYMADSTTKQIPLTTQSDPSIILQPPN